MLPNIKLRMDQLYKKDKKSLIEICERYYKVGDFTKAPKDVLVSTILESEFGKKAFEKNPSLTKGTTFRKFSGKQFYYAGRTLYPSKARLTALELAERGIDVKVTQDRGKGSLIWTEKRTNLDLAEPITGYYRNPKLNNMNKALSMRSRYKEDLAAGHKDAAEYWRGQASAYFTGNPTLSPEDFYYSPIYKKYDHFRLLHDNKVVLLGKKNTSLKIVSFNWFRKLQKIEDKQKYHY